MRVSDMEPTSRLVISESDEADTDLVSYIFSENNAFKSQSLTTERVDVEKRTHNSPRWSSRPLIAYLRDVFLPSGYPQSVSDDYLPYQVFDSLQAFCSSIAGLLSSRAVLQGVGVGNADASPTSALLLHILQDTSGRVATILFAHRVGTALEPECKTYRLAADVFNDLAMILDCLSPMVPAGVMRVSILSAAGVLRALCGVAGGSSKASLSAHFAKWGNLAELNAKDSSQETVISLIGMLVGSVVVSHVTGFTTTWIALLGLLALHLSMNYAAVRSVQMTSLNRQRSNIIFSALFESDPNLSQSLDKRRSLGSDSDKTTIQRNSESTSTSPRPSQLSPPLPLPHKILTPAQVASQERIFPRANALTWTSSLPTGNQVAKLGSAESGISLAAVLKHANGYVPATPISPSININQKASTAFYSAIPMTPFCNLFADEKYILFLYPGSRWYRDSSPKWHASILLKKDCAVTDQLKGWAHALLAARVLYMGFDPDASSLVKEVSNQTGSLSGVEISEKILRCVADTLKVLNEGDRFEGYLAALRASGWELDVGALEIKGGNRLILD